MVDRVVITERQDMSLASILARRGASGSAIGRAIGIDMPVGPRSAFGEDLTVIGSGPETWLACRPNAPSNWCAAMEQGLAGLASVSDQSGAYRMFRVTGADARTLLQRGVAIDLDRSVFVAGSVAFAAIAHLDIILSCREDGESYEVAIYRSYAESFMRWLDTAVAGL